MRAPITGGLEGVLETVYTVMDPKRGGEMKNMTLKETLDMFMEMKGLTINPANECIVVEDKSENEAQDAQCKVIFDFIKRSKGPMKISAISNVVPTCFNALLQEEDIKKIFGKKKIEGRLHFDFIIILRDMRKIISMEIRNCRSLRGNDRQKIDAAFNHLLKSQDFIEAIFRMVGVDGSTGWEWIPALVLPQLAELEIESVKPRIRSAIQQKRLFIVSPEELFNSSLCEVLDVDVEDVEAAAEEPENPTSAEIFEIIAASKFAKTTKVLGFE